VYETLIISKLDYNIILCIWMFWNWQYEQRVSKWPIWRGRTI